MPSALCQSRKRGHNAIEKRYRTNLNDKINCLREGIPSLSRQSISDAKSDEEGEGSDGEMDRKTVQQKYGKAAILTRALEYIKHLENTTQRLGGEVDVLKTRVGAFEKLAMSGSIVLTGNALGVQTAIDSVKSETLETIQAGTFSSRTRIKKLLADHLQISNSSSLNSMQHLHQHRGEEAQSKPRSADNCAVVLLW